MEHRSKKRGNCPTCGKATAETFRPFCSKRCSEVDLGRWLGGTYRIPTEEQPAVGDWPPEEGGDDT